MHENISAKVQIMQENVWLKKIGVNYLKGDCTRQEYLETVIKWISGAKNDEQIRDYMSIHQHDENAHELKNYLKKVIDWVEMIFPKYYRGMKGIEWGRLYNAYKNDNFNSEKLELAVSKLIMTLRLQIKKEFLNIFYHVMKHYCTYVHLIIPIKENYMKNAAEFVLCVNKKSAKTFIIILMKWKLII